MRDADCVFCAIVGGELPARFLYADDTVRTVPRHRAGDTRPRARRSTSSRRDLWEIDDDELAAVSLVARRDSARARDVLRRRECGFTTCRGKLPARTSSLPPARDSPLRRRARQSERRAWRSGSDAGHRDRRPTDERANRQARSIAEGESDADGTRSDEGGSRRGCMTTNVCTKRRPGSAAIQGAANVTRFKSVARRGGRHGRESVWTADRGSRLSGG